MTISLDTTDVPAVAADVLAGPMQFFIDSGRGLVMLRGLSKEDKRALRKAVRAECQSFPAAFEVATHLRFQSLVEVFSSRRLQALMMANGLAVIEPAIKIAAAMRLNTKWGFSPQKFHKALIDALAARRSEQEQAQRTPSEFEVARAARDAARPFATARTSPVETILEAA